MCRNGTHRLAKLLKKSLIAWLSEAKVIDSII
jgi:hypothetical protein